MDLTIRVQIMDKSAYISFSANTPTKNMNPIILPFALRKKLCRMGSLTLLRKLVEMENCELKAVKFRLKS